MATRPANIYVVAPNDTLSGIARQVLGAARRWPEIAQRNQLPPGRPLMIGQHLTMPVEVRQVPPAGPVRITDGAHGGGPPEDQPARTIPGLVYHYAVIDEWNPFTRRFVRKVAMPPPGSLDLTEIERILHPERHGFSPRAPFSPVSMGRHVGGRTDSRYISASELRQGSPRFQGEKFWINVDKARRAGVRVHESEVIIADLDRVIGTTKDATRRSGFERLRELSRSVDREVLLEGHIPPSAIKTGMMMGMTRAAQVVSGVGVVLTVYDVEQAAERSYRQQSIRPLAAETVRQAGGWAGAWAGFQLGGATGVMVGIETGPGALVTGLVGGVVGGVAGFTGANWVAHGIDP